MQWTLKAGHAAKDFHFLYLKVLFKIQLNLVHSYIPINMFYWCYIKAPCDFKKK